MIKAYYYYKVNFLAVQLLFDLLAKLAHFSQKTMWSSALSVYCSIGADTKDMFCRSKISESENFARYLNKYNVISLDITSLTSKATDAPHLLPYVHRLSHPTNWSDT